LRKTEFEESLLFVPAADLMLVVCTFKANQKLRTIEAGFPPRSAVDGLQFLMLNSDPFISSLALQLSEIKEEIQMASGHCRVMH
jgi:hypothetical protein